MKLIRICVLSFLFLGMNMTVHAQFWKKLKKKAEEKISKIEDKVIDNLDKNTDKKIDETIDGKKKEKTELSNELPKLNGGSSVLMLMNEGYEYQTEDIIISVYGKFTKDNLSSSVKTYNEDKLIAPVDAYPEGFALAYNKNGFLNRKKGQIIIHHADSTKVVFSLKGTWGFGEDKKPINASYISLNVTKINDVRKTDYNIEADRKQQSSAGNNNNSVDLFKGSDNSTIEIPDTFSFNKSLEIEMTSSNSDAIKMEFLLGDNKQIHAMLLSNNETNDQGTIYNVFTPESVTMFMDMPGMKIKKSMSISDTQVQDYSENMPKNAEDLKKTGATKSILGYSCEEYKFENDGHFVVVWVTKDFPLKNGSISMLGMAENNAFDGFVLELNMKSNNETIIVKATKYNPNRNVTINTNQYKSLGF